MQTIEDEDEDSVTSKSKEPNKKNAMETEIVFVDSKKD